MLCCMYVSTPYVLYTFLLKRYPMYPHTGLSYAPPLPVYRPRVWTYVSTYPVKGHPYPICAKVFAHLLKVVEGINTTVHAQKNGDPWSRGPKSVSS